MKTKKKLTLNKQVIQKLTETQMIKVAGGSNGDIITGKGSDVGGGGKN